jgi:Uma2 family endonuclease
VTEAEYVEAERRAERKSELVNGEVYAMAGAKPRHNALAMNLAIALGVSLKARGAPCWVLGSDQRVPVEATKLNTYPDVSVACPPAFHDTYRDALCNPTVLVEVLSSSTEAYDRGAKFSHYQRLESLTDYVLVSQAEHRVDHFHRVDSGQWLLTPLAGDDAVLELASIGCSIPLADLYAGAFELPGDDADGAPGGREG